MSRFFDTDLWHIPFAVSRVKVATSAYSFLGVRRYHIFGVLVAQIQETQPWDRD